MTNHDTKSNDSNQPKLIGVTADFGENADGLFVKKSQDIPQHLIDDIADHRKASSGKREGNFMKVASIPTVIIEKWMSEGFNIFDSNIKAADIVKRLKAENLEAFLTTEKSI